MLLQTVIVILLCNVAFGDSDYDYELDFMEEMTSPKSYSSKMIAFMSIIDSNPDLKDEWNERVEAANWDPNLPLFACNTSNNYPRAQTVNELTPWDIDVLATMGDSITAGNGLGADTLLQVAWENRGESWSIGGDYSYGEGVVTIGNILREFNPDVKGLSICVSQETEASKAWLNVAEPGGDNRDMPYQAQLIVDRCNMDERIDVNEDWKMVTLFIGGNDFCASCDEDYPDWIDPKHTPEAYGNSIELAMDIFYEQLPRTFVNLVPMFDITPLNTFNNTLCNVSHWLFCECVIRNETTMKPMQLAYYQEMVNIMESGKYINRSEDFAIVVQPMFVESNLPRNNETGLPERDFLSPDCFHPDRGAHQSFAWSLWNTMFYPVGQKPMNIADLDIEWTCPTDELPYFATAGNIPT